MDISQEDADLEQEIFMDDEDEGGEDHQGKREQEKACKETQGTEETEEGRRLRITQSSTSLRKKPAKNEKKRDTKLGKRQPESVVRYE